MPTLITVGPGVLQNESEELLQNKYFQVVLSVQFLHRHSSCRTSVLIRDSIYIINLKEFILGKVQEQTDLRIWLITQRKLSNQIHFPYSFAQFVSSLFQVFPVCLGHLHYNL